MASAALNTLSYSIVDQTSLRIQNLRAIAQTRGRLAGAMLVGTPADVTNQRTWLQEYMSAHSLITHELGTEFHSYAALIEAEDLALAGSVISVNDLKLTRDLEASGVITGNEQIAIDGWQLSTTELALISQRIGQVNDATIESV